MAPKLFSRDGLFDVYTPLEPHSGSERLLSSLHAMITNLDGSKIKKNDSQVLLEHNNKKYTPKRKAMLLPTSKESPFLAIPVLQHLRLSVLYIADCFDQCEEKGWYRDKPDRMFSKSTGCNFCLSTKEPQRRGQV